MPSAEGRDPFEAWDAVPWPDLTPPWHWRLRSRLRDLRQRAVCAVRGHRMQWYGGVVDWETGETDADYLCARCGRGEYDDD